MEKLDVIVSKIKRGMAFKNWRAADLARHSGLSKGTISKLLNGQLQTGDVRTLRQTAMALGYDQDEFLVDAGLLDRTKDAERNAELNRFERILKELNPSDRERLYGIAKTFLPPTPQRKINNEPAYNND